MPRKYHSVDFGNHPQQHHPQYKRSQSRNTSPSRERVNYTTRRAHSDTVSDTASVTSTSSSPTKTVNSDGGGHFPLNFKLTSHGTRSTRSTDSSGIIHTRETINSVKRAIEVLNKSISDERRIDAIKNACVEFDHWDEVKHNAELHYGAADILTMYLSNTEDDNEIRQLCAALEMVFRSAANYVKHSYAKVGSSIVPLLLRLLKECEGHKDDYSSPTITHITKILLVFSRVPDLRPFLVRHKGMFDALKRVSSAGLNDYNRVLRMRLLANLANCDANKMTILQYPGLLEAVLRVAALDSSEQAREFAGLSLMDMAAEPQNQIKMANVDKLLGTLVKLAVLENIPDTRESAVTALQNLAFCKDNRVRLVTYGSGVVVEALKKVVGNDKDAKARRRAAGALTNLACDETGEQMAKHKGLVDTLARASTRDESADVQQRAAMALTKIATSVPKKSPSHKNVLDALVIASDSNHAVGSVMAVMRVKTRDVECRVCMAFHPGILDALADAAINPKLPLKDRDNAMRSIMHLTNEPSNCKVMCCKKILNALVLGVSQGEDDIASSAITAMERLASNEVSNRPHMARHEGLLTAVAKATEREAKLEASGVGSTDKSMPLLAKPLLMSLLVAM